MELTPQQSFEQKITDRLKDSIGDLIPDEVLKEKVNDAMHQAFFEPRIVPDKKNHYGHVIEKGYEKVPFIVDVTKTLIEKEATRQINLWIQKHHEEIITLVEKIIDDGILKHTVGIIDERTQGISLGMVDKVREALENGTTYYHSPTYYPQGY